MCNGYNVRVMIALPFVGLLVIGIIVLLVWAAMKDQDK